MAAAYKAIIADCGDLKRVIVNCSSCKAAVVVALADAKGIDYCPSCETPFDHTVKDAIQALQRFVRHAAAAEGNDPRHRIFQFEINIEPPSDRR